MLARRRIHSSLYSGLRCNPHRQIAVYGWLRTGDQVITEGPDISRSTLAFESPLYRTQPKKNSEHT